MSGKPTHGLSYAPEYRAWQTMRLRCTDPDHPAYPNYGGRGIRVCKHWLDSPVAFVADMGTKPSEQHEIDRIDNDGHYEPGNCRWATRTENSRNRRNNRLIEHDGEVLPLVAWAERYRIGRDTVRKRLEAGWPVSEALTVPARPKAKNGQAAPRHCEDCGQTIARRNAARCKSCENRRRAREARCLP
jgi:ribosomal protein S16